MNEALEKLAAKLAIPVIAVSDISRISVESDSFLLAEGIRRVLSVEPDEIIILSRRHRISVCGTDLQIKLITEGTISVSGKITDIKYMPAEVHNADKTAD